MSLATRIAKVRLSYHASMIDLVNAGNQIGLIKDEKAERMNRDHVMTIMTDILPRIYGQALIDSLVNG